MSVILRVLLRSFSLAAAPALAQTGEPRAWDSRAGRWVAWGAMADSPAAEGMGCPLSALPRELFVQVSGEFADADLEAMFDARASVEARAAAGGTSPASVQAQIAELTVPLL